MKHDKKIAMLLSLTLGVSPLITSVGSIKSYADNKKESKINEATAKKLGVKESDVEFSNIDSDLVNDILSEIKPNFVGITSETIETKVFTRSELIALRKIQDAIYEWYVDELSTSDVQYLVKAAFNSLSSISAKKLGFLLGFKVGAVYSGVSLLLGLINKQHKSVMLRWIKDGRVLLRNAIGTGRRTVKLKYVKLSWKTSNMSIITGGIILK